MGAMHINLMGIIVSPGYTYAKKKVKLWPGAMAHAYNSDY